MKRLLLTAAAIAFLPAVSHAQNVGQCGWGSKLFAGQKGIVPQVLAVTTNGTSGNQTFGITSGTSGCTQDGVVKSSWKTAMFIGANMDRLARDMSAGQGETLESLASLIGVEDGDKAAFFTATKENFARIFPSKDVASEQVATSLRDVLASSETLARYSAKL